MILTDLHPSDIEPGQPLRHSVFDQDKNLLLSRGNIVSAALHDKLLKLGAYKLTLGADEAPVTAPEPGEPLTPAAWRTCSAVAPLPGKPVRSSTTPAELFDRWIDFMHITDGISGEPVSCRLSLLGVIDATCLMVTSATLERDWIAMQPGRQFTATVFDGRRIFTFATTIVSRFEQPFRYLHLSFPSELAERPPRRTLRASVELEAVLMHDGEHTRESTSAEITDLSTTSAGVRTTNLRLAIGTRVLLTFALHAYEGDAMPVRIPAIVRRQRIEPGSAVATYGLEFVEVPPSVRTHLEAYVARSSRPY
jgi:c-di-GMP-binding flagellar brake protein YcgR